MRHSCDIPLLKRIVALTVWTEPRYNGLADQALVASGASLPVRQDSSCLQGRSFLRTTVGPRRAGWQQSSMTASIEKLDLNLEAPQSF